MVGEVVAVATTIMTTLLMTKTTKLMMRIRKIITRTRCGVTAVLLYPPADSTYGLVGGGGGGGEGREGKGDLS